MIKEQTFEKMKKMRMNHLAQLLKEMEENKSMTTLSFDERIGILIDTEWNYRQNRRSQLLNKQSDFTEKNACIEGIDYQPERNIDKALIFQLATCDYIKARQDALILVKTGVGKSYMAQALGNSACRNGIPTRYITLADLFDELAVAAQAGQLNQAFDSFIKPPLLILDDYFLTKPSNMDAERLLKLVEKRMHIGSTIYCSQLNPEKWHARVDEKIIADAILDRVVNRSHVLTLEGESMRKRMNPEQ